MKNIFEYIFSKSSLFLFLVGLTLAIILTVSFSYLSINHPMLLINAEPSEFDFFKSTTLLGKFYMICGIFPNFLFLIILFRLIRYIISTFLELLIRFFEILGAILGLIFSNENFNKLRKTFASNKPRVVKAIKKIKLKKKIEKDYLMPISIIIAASILAIAIFFQ